MTQSQAWLLIVVGLILAGLLYILQPVLTPFLVGIGIAYLADPFADRLEARGWPRSMATVMVFSVLILLLVGLFLGIYPLLIKQIQTLVQMLPSIEIWFNATLLPWLQSSLGLDVKSMKLDLVTEGLAAEWKQTGGVISRVAKYATESSMGLISTLGSVAMVPVVAFYMLRDFDLVTERIKMLLPLSIQPQVNAWAIESNDVLAAFMRGQLLVMLSLGAIYALGLHLVGLNYALLIGVLAGLASVVPYLGFVVGIAAALTISLFQFDNYLPLAMVLVVFFRRANCGKLCINSAACW